MGLGMGIDQPSSPYLDITCPAIEIEMQVLDLAILGKQVRDVFLRGLLVDIRRDHNPPFNTAHGHGGLSGSPFSSVLRPRLLHAVVGGGRQGAVLRRLPAGRHRVDFHFRRHGGSLEDMGEEQVRINTREPRSSTVDSESRAS